MKFLAGLDNDIRQNVLRQLRDLWTYTSTGLEGNSLSLGDTQFVLEEGLTVSGKPIKDHQEVIGHAKAIDLVYEMIGKEITEEDLFKLHRAIQVEVVSDIYKPYGAWKLEPNGTYAVSAAGKQVFIEYALPSDVPLLMNDWLHWLNQVLAGADSNKLDVAELVAIYAQAHMGFVHIHPFWDGNGRLARLLANLPLLAAGLPPLVIARESRQEYLKTLAAFQIDVGQLSRATGVWPKPSQIEPFTQFLAKEYELTQELLTTAFAQQQRRHKQ